MTRFKLHTIIEEKKNPQYCHDQINTLDDAPEPVVHCMKDYSKVRSKQVESKVASACPNQHTLAKKSPNHKFFGLLKFGIFNLRHIATFVKVTCLLPRLIPLASFYAI